MLRFYFARQRPADWNKITFTYRKKGNFATTGVTLLLIGEINKLELEKEQVKNFAIQLIK